MSKIETVYSRPDFFLTRKNGSDTVLRNIIHLNFQELNKIKIGQVDLPLAHSFGRNHLERRLFQFI